MANPNSRKRLAQGADEVSDVNVIALTPQKAPRNGEKLKETPKKNAARATTNTTGTSMIPPDSSTGRGAARSVHRGRAVGEVVTPQNGQKKRPKLNNPSSRRALRLEHNESPPLEASAPPVTPSQATKKVSKTVTPPPLDGGEQKAAKRRLIFGKLVAVKEIVLQPNTKRVYGLVKKLTGSLGGNGSCGPIYGELTQGSMQKMVNLMRQHTQLDSNSRFIDVGSGIGKPNLHVTQDPGVAFSCGIEMELDRYRLGLKCLQSVLQEAVKDSDSLSEETKIQHKCMFLHGNIMQAKTFDPFTHVYMFSIGFPPKLWVHLSEAWNRSRSPFLICFHGPRSIINTYEFDVELLTQMSTSMHASGEGHTGYIYQRKGITQDEIDKYVAKAPCDKLFQQSYRQVQAGLPALAEVVDQTVAENWTSRGRSMTRSEARKHGIVLSKS